MSNIEGNNDNKSDGDGAGPTRSFDGSVVGPGRQIGHFRIEREIGRGGAGVVYLAHDTKLDRRVAIKSLPPELMRDAHMRSRLKREAKLLASLDHPNIATIHDVVEQAESGGYLILEYIEGDTLAERIAQRPLDPREALSIAHQIAEAVAAAHEHGVTHRDLKPGNIKITPDGKVKVLDFGLAKAVSGEATDQESTITEPGRVMGTPAYMSPEQARGKPTDKRCDIWSFGCVVYEMLTGTVPFEGETVSDTLANILQTEPNWQVLPESTPTNIVLLLRRCLEKEPRRRLRDIGDIALTLEETTIELQHPSLQTKPIAAGRAESTKLWRRVLPWFIAVTAMAVLVLFAFIMGLNVGGPSEKQSRKSISGAAVTPIKAIVVLPFDNLSGDPEQEYFVDGMREVLVTELGKIRALTVKGEHSATLYKGTDKQTPEIARELGVDAVIRGSVFKPANAKNVRITARLIHGLTEENLWGDSYEDDLSDVITLQRKVALAVATEIKVGLTPQEGERLASARPVNPQAHDAYLKGRFFLNKRSEEGLKTAISFFEQAKNLDPDYALAHVGLADCHILQGAWGFAPSQEVFPKAKREAEQALKIDDSLGEAHNSRAYAIACYDWDWSDAEREFRRAIELNPNYATAHHWYSDFLGWMGRFDEALAESERAQELDPLSLIIRSDFGQSLSLVGKHDESIGQLREVLQMDPDFLPALCYLANTYMRKSMFRESIAPVERVATIRGRDASSVAWLAFIHASAGNTGEAQTLLQELLDRSEKGERVPVGALSQLYASLGDKDRAFELIDEIIKRDRWPACTLKTDPKWDPMRDDPRFGDLLRRMNFPEAPTSESVAEPAETAEAPIEKIAVLPFTSISSEAGEEWFVDGMTVTLTARLGKIKALTVISSRSAMELKGTSKPVREIAQELGVDALIQGTVIRVGNNVRVTAELIDGRRDEQIWADIFLGTFDDILALQSEVTLGIAKKIEVALTPEEEKRITRTKTVNPEAYEAYLKGIFFHDQLTKDSLERAAYYFEEAVKIQPDYTEAHAWLAASYLTSAGWGYGTPHENFARAKTEANTAIKLDKTCGEAHCAVGWIALTYDWDWQKAKQSFELAIDLSPNLSRGHQGRAFYLLVAGRFDEAIDAMQTAVKLDPLSSNLNNGLANVYSYCGRIERAIELHKEALKLDPLHLDTLSDLARSYLVMSRYADAEKSIEDALNHHGRTAHLVASLARTYALWGRKSEAEKLLQELQDRDKDEYILPSNFARVHAALGNENEALTWLEKAYQEQEWFMVLIKVSPWWDPLRSDPHFDNLVRRMKFPE